MIKYRPVWRQLYSVIGALATLAACATFYFGYPTLESIYSGSKDEADNKNFSFKDVKLLDNWIRKEVAIPAHTKSSWEIIEFQNSEDAAKSLKGKGLSDDDIRFLVSAVSLNVDLQNEEPIDLDRFVVVPISDNARVYHLKTGIKVTPGVYKIRLSAKGYNPVIFTRTVTEKEYPTVNIRLLLARLAPEK